MSSKKVLKIELQEMTSIGVTFRASSTGIGTGIPGSKLSTGTKKWKLQEPGNLAPKSRGFRPNSGHLLQLSSFVKIAM